MKVVTVRQPWATLIIAGVKPVENRTWATKHRGPLLIHAGATVDAAALARMTDRGEEWRIGHGLPPWHSLPRRALLGLVDIADVRDLHELERATDTPQSVREWASGPKCWLLRDPAHLNDAGVLVPLAGRLSLWDIPAGELVEALRTQARAQGAPFNPDPRILAAAETR